ncbi:hypothetical protein RF11_04540 [Thelohanellus kitauei]|uniref:Transposase Tc1-like domain-containing protein n=1 Tax=Thelohanellus kitauei TaxID=669202 RepID=A0A0C2IQE4_THEKT|nr:hypothetical protein RF11_04540 [Thelohanellus kitauei]
MFLRNNRFRDTPFSVLNFRWIHFRFPIFAHVSNCFILIFLWIHLRFPIFTQYQIFLYQNRKLEFCNQNEEHNKLSTDVKILAINYVQRNPEKSIAEVVRNLSLNERSLRYTYSKFLRDGYVIQNNQAGSKYIKVEEQHKLCIGQYIEENPIITIAQILSKLQEDFNLVLSKSTICRTIKKLNITYKLVRQVPIARNTQEIIEARFIYSQTYFER